jgi:hypothetical protein
MTPAAWYAWHEQTLVLTLWVQPRAKRDEIVGPHAGALKVRITSPPVDGKANAHLCAWFAELCGVAKNQVALHSGSTDRRKRIRIHQPRTLPPGVIPPP